MCRIASSNRRDQQTVCVYVEVSDACKDSRGAAHTVKSRFRWWGRDCVSFIEIRSLCCAIPRLPRQGNARPDRATCCLLYVCTGLKSALCAVVWWVQRLREPRELEFGIFGNLRSKIPRFRRRRYLLPLCGGCAWPRPGIAQEYWIA